MITIKIKGRDHEAAVDDEGRLCVLSSTVPPKNPPSETRIFRQYMTLDGLVNNGTNENMLVDGATANKKFYIAAADDADRYIDSINFLLAGAGAELDEFVNAARLNVGCSLSYEDPTLGNVMIHDAIKSNFEFLRLCAKGVPAIGDGVTAFRAQNVSGSGGGAFEGYFMTLDFSDQFNIPYGIRIPKDSTFKISLLIRDDLSAITGEFTAIAYGYDRIIK